MAADSSLHRQRLQPGGKTTTITLPPMPSQPRSSRYKILKLHGRGGMGEIWLAEDEHIGRQVAFKCIRGDKEQALERFFAEAQVTGQLEHPGIVPVHELGQDQDGKPFYVMRMIHGRTLKDVIAECHAANKRGEADEELRWLRLLGIVISLCRTISFAHSRGVIHRDLKPDNVMVGQYGEAFVLDWGLCKLSGHPDPRATESTLPVRLSGGHGSTATQDGEVVGSPLYMSPEMADGRIAEEDVRTDVYLLGATLYEVLTNRPPRGGSTQQEIVELARTSPPVPPRKINPRVSPALEAICLKAMSYRSDDRYETAQEVADEIERYLAGEPVKAYPEPILRRSWRWAVKRRAAVGRGALVVALLMVAAASALAWRNAANAAADSRRKAAAAAQELADRKQLDRARQDLATFRELEETLHYQLSDTTPLADQVGVTDPAAAADTWQKLQNVVGHWQPILADFPLEAERAELQRAYAELVLWRVQSLTAQPLTSQTADALLADLQAIAELHRSPYSFQRLRSECLAAAGNNALAEQALKQAQTLQPRQGAFDHFLEGEKQRYEAVAHSADDGDEIGRPSRTFLQQAAASYGRCLGLDPQYFWAHLQKGRAHLVHRDEFDEALQHFSLAAAIRPQSPTAWTTRGLALGVLGDFKAAKHDLNYAVSLPGRPVTALLNRGAIELLQKNFANAQKDFLAAQAADPKNLPAAYYLAMLDFQQGKLPAAQKGCSAVLARAPALRPALLLQLRIHLSQNDKNQALATLALLDPPNKTALQKAADRCGLLRSLAAGRALKPALELAEAEGQRAADGGLKSAALYYELGRVQWFRGKHKEALETWNRGLECEGSETIMALLHKARGLRLVEREEFGLAKEDYTKAAQIAGDQVMHQRIRAESRALLGYIAAKQSDKALAEREAALAMAQLLNFNEWDIWRNLGCTYAAMADHDTEHSQELQDIAMLMLKNAIFQARRTNSVGTLAIAKRAIQKDPALQPLSQRQDFKDLMAPPATPGTGALP